jgi:hypothetical protein
MTPRSRRRKAADGNESEDSCYPSSDSSKSSDGGVSLRPASDIGHDVSKAASKSDRDNNAVGPSQQFILLRSTSDHTDSQDHTLPWDSYGTSSIAQLGGRFDDLTESSTSSTGEGALEISSVISASRPASPDNTTSFQPIHLNKAPSSSASQALAAGAPPNLNKLGKATGSVAVHGPNQKEHTHSMNTTETSSSKARPPRHQYFAYVEDADSDEAATRTGSLDSLAVHIDEGRDRHHRTAPEEFLPESEQPGVFYNTGFSTSSSRAASSLSSDNYPSSTYPSDDRSSGVYRDGHDMGKTQSRSISPSLRTLPPSSHQSSLSEDMNHTGSPPMLRRAYPKRILRPRRTDTPMPRRAYPKRILRPRRTDTPMTQNFPNPPLSSYPGYTSFAPNDPTSNYGPPPPTHIPYNPQVPPYAPSVPVPNHDPPFAPSNPYGQYPRLDIPPGYPNYVQYQQGNPYPITPNPNYPNYYQPPPPPSTIIPELPIKSYPLNPGASKLTSHQEPENVFQSVSAVKTTSSYKAPVSSDPSGHDISFQMSLKKSGMLNIPWRGEMAGHWEMDNSPDGPGGNGYITRIRSLEYYADRSGQDKITILCPQLSVSDMSASGGMGVLRWLYASIVYLHFGFQVTLIFS